MAWTFIPTTGSSGWFEWRKYIQFWRAIYAERYAVTAAPYTKRNPSGNIPYYTGTITAITDTTITDDAQTWSASRQGSNPWWYNYDPPGTSSDYLPNYYTVVIDPDAADPWSVVIVDITAAEVGNVLTVKSIADYVAAGCIPSVASLVGKTYCIISGPTTDFGFGLWWSTRWPAYPNAREIWKGTTTRGSAVTLTETTRTDGAVVDVATKALVAAGAAQAWATNQFVPGYDVLVYGSDNLLHRERIIGNTSDTLRWAGTGPGAIELDFATTIDGPFSLKFNALNGKYEWTGDKGADQFTVIVTGTSWTGSGSYGGVATDFAGTINGSRQFVVTAAGSYGATIAGEIPDHWYPTGAYVIVEKDKRAWPGRKSTRSRLDYGGHKVSRAATYPNDTVGACKIAAATITLSTYNAIAMACETTSSTLAFDRDVITLDVENCEPYDKHWSPDLYKSLRQIQVDIESLFSSFVEAKNYDGAEAIPLFTIATGFKKADVNHGTVTVSGPDGAGNYFFSADTKYNGWTAEWSIINADTSIATSGSGTVTAGLVTLGAGYAAHVGKALVYSATWDRRWWRRHRWKFDKTGFIPDVNSGAAVVPPVVVNFASFGSLGVGTWTHRGKSLNYAEFSQYGVIGDSGPAFIAGEASRFIGDDWYHGVLGTFDNDGTSPVINYWHNFVVKDHPSATQANINAQLFGDATSGTDRTLTDTRKNWWSDWYAGSGSVLHTESGTATAGGTNTLSDTAKDITLEAGQFWIAARFNGFSAPYVGFVVEVQDPQTGIWHRRVIKTCTFTGNKPTITWDVALPFVADSCAYRIREPRYELNRWQGRTVRLTFTNGDVEKVTITHSDDITLYFEPFGRVVGPGTSYEIEEPQVGTVWQFRTEAPASAETFIKIATNQYWVKPTGADDSPRGNWSARPWRDNARYNQPTIV